MSKNGFYELDADHKAIRDINKEIRSSDKRKFKIVNPNARHHIGVCVLKPVQIVVDGSVGYYCMGLVDGPSVTIKGNAGWYLGENMMNGTIVVEGNAGVSVGACQRGGAIFVRGSVGSRAGQVKKGGTILVGGDAGFMTGNIMMGGNIVVLGEADELLGDNMIHGQIYIAGKYRSLGKDAIETGLNEQDKMYLSSVLDTFEIKKSYNFKKIVASGASHHYKKKEY